MLIHDAYTIRTRRGVCIYTTWPSHLCSSPGYYPTQRYGGSTLGSGQILSSDMNIFELFFHVSDLCMSLPTLTTSSSVERHSTDSVTSVTVPSVPTVTTFTGMATVFPVSTAVLRISVSCTQRADQSDCVNSGKFTSNYSR